MMLLKLLSRLSKRPSLRKPKTMAQIEAEYLAEEAAIGGTLFGTLPEGVARLFYCKDPSTWVWQEAWTDNAGRPQTLTTSYHLSENAIFKNQANLPAQLLNEAEIQNFAKAVEWYHRLVMRNVYHQLV